MFPVLLTSSRNLCVCVCVSQSVFTFIFLVVNLFAVIVRIHVGIKSIRSFLDTFFVLIIFFS